MKTAYGDPALDGLAAILLRDSCGCAECRRQGYGGAVTAAASQAALDAGAGHVALFTDLANPTSNALYQRLGYQPVEDRVVLRFGA